MFEFQCQKQHPTIGMWDYFATLFTRRVTLEYIEKQLVDAKVPDKDCYSADKVKKDLTQIVEERLMKEAAEFDK